MYQLIFGLTPPGETARDDIQTDVGRTRGIVVDETQQYLDGARIQAGEAARHINQETEQAHLNPGTNSIDIEPEPVSETLHTEWVADVAGAGFAAGDSSDGEFVFGLLDDQLGIPLHRAEIDIPALAGHLETQHDANWWQVGWGGEDADEAGVAYHNTSWVQDPTREETTQLGFSYWSESGKRVRGTTAASGYLALFSPDFSPAQLGRWLRDNVLPFAGTALDETADETSEQETLDGTGDDSDADEEVSA